MAPDARRAPQRRSEKNGRAAVGGEGRTVEVLALLRLLALAEVAAGGLELRLPQKLRAGSALVHRAVRVRHRLDLLAGTPGSARRGERGGRPSWSCAGVRSPGAGDGRLETPSEELVRDCHVGGAVRLQQTTQQTSLHFHGLGSAAKRTARDTGRVAARGTLTFCWTLTCWAACSTWTIVTARPAAHRSFRRRSGKTVTQR